MKNTITIILGFIALGFLIVTIKNNFNSNPTEHERAFEAYERINLKLLEKNMHQITPANSQ